MVASFRSIAIFLVCSVVKNDAKVINAETDSSYTVKVQTGVSQALQWMSEMVMPETVVRPPRKVKLALVGLGRTGSTSFSAALKELGFAPVHDDEATEVADLYGAWTRGGMKQTEWLNMELGRRGFDAPMVSIHSYVKWAATAPDIKVILTVRDKHRWAESWLCITPAAWFPVSRPFKWIPAMSDLAEFNHEVMVTVPTNGHPELYQDIPTLEAGYDAWVEFVRNTVPKDRLLEFDVKQGWGPLCDFLGKPVPSVPFPHINDRVVIDVIIKVFQAVTWIWPMIPALLVFLLWGCFRCCCRRLPRDDAKKNA